MTYRLAAIAVALAFFVAFFALGNWTVLHGEPVPLMQVASALVGHGALVAWWLTWLGYVQVLFPMCLGLLALAWRFPRSRMRALFSVASLIVCWQAATLAQRAFARPRRLDWIVKHETAFSYPSSHAAIAFGFYLVVAAFAATSGLRYGRSAGVLSGIVAAAICWARLALGAHYVTDVAGGALLAVACVAALAAALPINVFAASAVRT